MELSIEKLERVLRAAADVCAEIAAEDRAERRDWTDQTTSPLGRRRHVNAVRRRVAAGDAGAAVVGRRHLLSGDALAAELAAVSKGTSPKSEQKAAQSGPEALRARLGLVVGGAR
jgi:hypothetical protein